uniref:Uncharacterized protein n=1 Tax=Tanacetum cinerariifolium TaxID=118510 RepID=A0A6L2MSZ9_TANCI|nr:hypothetical protein [Tanacetum cinerariifolium]
MQTEMELELEQTEQGSSHEVSSQHQTALRISRWRYNLTPAESKFKTPMLDHQDKHKMNAQVHVSKSSAISDVQALPRRKHYCQNGKSIKSYSKPGKKITIQYSKPENPNELFQKLLEDLKELAEYKESLENSSNETTTLSSNQEKEEPPQDSDIHQLIEECSTEVYEEKKQSMEDTMLELVKICRQKELLCMHDNVEDLIEITPILSNKEPEYSTSMGYEHPNTTPETESDEIIKSGVEELISILKENEVTSEDKRECDVPVCENSPVCDDHSKIFSDFNNDDDISSYEESFEDIEFLEASFSDPEIVSVEEENVVQQEEEEVDFEDISQIQDVDLQSDNSLSDNFSPEFETFCDHTEETRSGNTTHADDSFPEYDSFCFEIEPDQERLINVLKNDISDNSSNDPLLEEADLFLAFDNSIPPGIENVVDDSEGDIYFLEELLIDDSILSHESSDSNFEDNPSVPLPHPEQPDADFELDFGNKISVVMNKFECLRDEFDDSFIFVIFAKVFSLLSAESEDTIFDPGFTPHRLKFLVLDICHGPKDLHILSLRIVWGSPYP